MLKKWLQKLIRKFISWLYTEIENERTRRQAAIRNVAAEIRDAEDRHRAGQRLKEITKRQNNCSHLKGGGRLATHNDYAVWHHVFPDGSETIKCLICGKPWTKQSPDWQIALNMMNHSSNSKSASEHGFKPRDEFEPDKVYVPQTDDGNVSPFTGRYAPFVSDSYVIRVWDRLYKKLTRKKKLDNKKKLK
jgi:hypothetical protein